MQDRRNAGVIVLSLLRSPLESLTNTTVKGLLWADLIQKSTSTVRACVAACPQVVSPETLGFWHYLDASSGHQPYSTLTSGSIHALESRFRAFPRQPSYEQLAHRAGSACSGALPPVAQRNLHLLAETCELLGISVPAGPVVAPVEEVISRLVKHDLIQDDRNAGGPVWLDAQSWGKSLTPLMSVTGAPTYLAQVLQAVIPFVDAHEDMVALYPVQATKAYVLLQRVLQELGVRMHGIALAEVEPAELVTEQMPAVERDVLRLCLRHYFIGILGKTGRSTLEPEHLNRAVRRAERFLQRTQAAAQIAPRDFLTPYEIVDPYRLTTTLLARRSPYGISELVRALYL